MRRSLASWGALAALFVGGLPGCAKYDELIEKDQVAQQRWADIEAALQRRADLVPNLVATVKAAAAQEQDTLTKVIEARSKATSIQMSAEDLQDPQKMAAFQAAQDSLRGALSRLLVVQEQYPQLRSSEAFRDLQVQLEGTENRLLRSRERYNEAVSDYNATLGKIGGAIVKRATGGTFKPRVYFSATSDAQKAPRVEF
ncbi:MAG: LemA family protein [Myxococcaceae bacterium]